MKISFLFDDINNLYDMNQLLKPRLSPNYTHAMRRSKFMFFSFSTTMQIVKREHTSQGKQIMD